jgi:hypothetical protein
VARICYLPKNFRPATIDLISVANGIIEEYAADGYKMTTRQVYYQLVARGLIPNTMASYGKVKKTISDARLAGYIDWDHIVDRTRKLEEQPHWDSPADIVSACASQFRLDKWAKQPRRVEVWVEKQALIGIFEGVCRELDVPYIALRGYVSQSIQWGAAQRHRKIERETGQLTHVLHFGDHDPSGIDMTRDNQARLDLFGARTKVTRVALNMDQVEEYDPPPNPAKQTDARYAGYEEDFGDSSWELDALEPRVLVELVRKNVFDLLDEEQWAADTVKEEDAKNELQTVADYWSAAFVGAEDAEMGDES